MLLSLSLVDTPVIRDCWSEALGLLHKVHETLEQLATPSVLAYPAEATDPPLLAVWGSLLAGRCSLYMIYPYCSVLEG
jgi:hypothetical protein